MAFLPFYSPKKKRALIEAIERFIDVGGHLYVSKGNEPRNQIQLWVGSPQTLYRVEKAIGEPTVDYKAGSGLGIKYEEDISVGEAFLATGLKIEPFFSTRAKRILFILDTSNHFLWKTHLYKDTPKNPGEFLCNMLSAYLTGKQIAQVTEDLSKLTFLFETAKTLVGKQRSIDTLSSDTLLTLLGDIKFGALIDSLTSTFHATWMESGDSDFSSLIDCWLLLPEFKDNPQAFLDFCAKVKQSKLPENVVFEMLRRGASLEQIDGYLSIPLKYLRETLNFPATWIDPDYEQGSNSSNKELVAHEFQLTEGRMPLSVQYYYKLIAENAQRK